MTARVLLLGGIDPGGGAGITADATVVSAHGLQPLPIAVVLTAQNRHRFREQFAIPEHQWRAALEAALGDGPVHAVKIGLLGSAEVVAAVAAALQPLAARMPIVVDPVLSATAGGFAAPAAVAAAYREHLLPLAALLTPNSPELEAIAGGDLDAVLATGCGAVLHKGGHGAGDSAEDVLYRSIGVLRFRRPRLGVGPVHGTGCALASAIAARLAAGQALAEACGDAGNWLAALLRALGPPAADGLPRPLPFARCPPVS